MSLDQIPRELTALRQWVLWRVEEVRGRRTKVLYNARTLGHAKSNEPSTWTSYVAAREALGAAPEFDGIGFVFSDNDPYVGIDLDACFDDKGNLTDEAREFVELIDSYTELSQSGKGLHIIARGSLPPSGRKKANVEMYEARRFFAITGDHFPGTPDRVMDRHEEVAEMHRRVWPPEPEPVRRQPVQTAVGSLDDRDLIERARRANPKFDRLWDGDISAFPSQSEAELALADHLAYWTGGDESRIDSLARQWCLYRSKWDRKDYRDRTLAKATNGVRIPVNGASVVSVVQKTQSETELKPPRELEPEALYGMPGQVVLTIEPHTESSQAAILGSFLIGIGCLLGPGPHVYRDGARHTANEFVCLVGSSSVGRKGTATRRTDELFKYLYDSNSNNSLHVMHERQVAYSDLVIRGLGSGEALIETLADPDEDRRRVVFEEEFAKVIKVMRREGSTLSDTLRAAWDGGILANRTKGKHLQAKNTHVGILGHITETELKSVLSATELFNGFANRFLWFTTERSKLLPFGGGDIPYAPLVSELHSLLDYSQVIGRVEFDEQCQWLWSNEGGQLYKLLSERPEDLWGSVTSRAAPHVLRLALIYTVLDAEKVIRAPHLLAALAVWDFNEKSCAHIFGASTGDDMADQIEELLREAYPGYLTRKEIRDAFSRNAKPGSIPRGLEVLRNHNRAEQRQVATDGRHAEAWVATEQKVHDRNDRSPLKRARELLG